LKEVIVILDNIRSALNVGAIFRSCNGAGVSKLYLTGITPHPPHPKVSKTALGTENEVQFEYIKNASEVVDKYKLQGFKVYSLEENSRAVDYYETELNQKAVLIFGHEITGVSNELMDKSDAVLKLPMKGKKNSLNVSNTVAIVLYDIMFSRK
jgi:tRNA G18 (ribose-2'-O)-methylase SpoU